MNIKSYNVNLWKVATAETGLHETSKTTVKISTMIVYLKDVTPERLNRGSSSNSPGFPLKACAKTNGKFVQQPARTCPSAMDV